ncbi:ExbD/TolR family protein [Psychromonas sp. KJ10-10]|uniref:ExbD/TolR family protein n=1 Tax=Psychromonas sp. KJ10-10 TaxID=3391823 RepID=UPI0039B3DD2E
MLIPEVTKAKTQNDDNLIPLINVVFLMLIFFMVAGHIEHSDVVKTNPPQSVNEQALQKENIAELLVTEKSELFLNGESVNADNLSEQLKLASAQSQSIENYSVLVKVDEKLDVVELKKVLRHIKATRVITYFFGH